MNTGTSVVVSTVIVGAGTVSEGKGISINIVVGGAVLALMLAALDSANPDFASKMALLVLVAALFRYAVPIAQALGFVKK